MRPTRVCLCLLLAFGMLFAATNVSDYLYSGETQTGSEQFNALESQYTIIYVDSKEAFLLKNGEIVSNEAEMEAALHQYYYSKYYPSSTQIENLTTLFDAYQASRNDGAGTSYKGVEEATCRMDLGMTSFTCTNSSVPDRTNYTQMKNNDCFMLSLMLVTNYGEAFSADDPFVILPDIQQFALASNDMTRIQNETDADLRNVSPDNIYDVLYRFQQNIPKMRADEKALETSKLRYDPRPGAKQCKDCYAFCLVEDINETYLNEAEQEVGALLPGVQKIDQYKEKAQAIYNSTVSRMNFEEGNVLGDYYSELFAPEKTRAEAAVEEANSVLAYVEDDSLRTAIGRINLLIPQIDSDISSDNFNAVNASRNELDAKTNLIEEQAPVSMKIYNDTAAAKDRASAILFLMETTDLPDSMQGNVSSLKVAKRTLDRNFVAGLPPEKYTELTNSYSQISDDASAIIGNAPVTEKVVDQFKGAGRKTNEGVADLAATLSPMQREGREQVSGYAPLLLASLSFFSLSSLAMFIFLFAFSTLSIFRRRVFLFLGVLLLAGAIFGSAAVAFSAYTVLTSSSTDASFSDFQSYVLGSHEVSILVDTANVSGSGSSKMMGCANTLASSLRAQGKQAVIYQRNDGECITEQNTTLGECYNSIKEPIIVFSYSAVDRKPQFTTAFVYKGTFFGDEEYFNECEIGKVFTESALPAAGFSLPGQNQGGNASGSNPVGNQSGGNSSNLS